MDNITDNPISGGKRVVICLYAWLACEAAIAVSALLTLYALGGYPGNRSHEGAQNLADIVRDSTAAVSVLAYPLTAIIVLRWVYRSARNAARLSDRITVTPGWAVGRFFVPVLNLWKPFQGMAEIWRVSVNPDAPDVVPTPPMLRWWWGLWLASGVFGHIGGRMALKADTPKQGIDAAWADLILFAINVPLVFVLVRIVTQLSAMQHALLTQPADAIDAGHAP